MYALYLDHSQYSVSSYNGSICLANDTAEIGMTESHITPTYYTNVMCMSPSLQVNIILD